VFGKSPNGTPTFAAASLAAANQSVSCANQMGTGRAAGGEGGGTAGKQN